MNQDNNLNNSENQNNVIINNQPTNVVQSVPNIMQQDNNTMQLGTIPNNQNPSPVNPAPKKKSVIPLVIVILIVLVVIVGGSVLLGGKILSTKIQKFMSTEEKDNRNDTKESDSSTTKNYAKDSMKNKEQLTIIGEKMSNRLEQHIHEVMKKLDDMDIEAEVDITANDITYKKNNDVTRISSKDDEYYYVAFIKAYNKKTGLLIDVYHVRCQWDEKNNDIINYGDNVKYRKVEEIYERAMEAVIFVDTKYWGDWVYDVDNEYDNYVNNFLGNADEYYMIFLDDVTKDYYNTYVSDSKTIANKAKNQMMKKDATIQLYVVNSGNMDVDTLTEFIKEVSDADRSPTVLSISDVTDLIDKMDQKYYELIK